MKATFFFLFLSGCAYTYAGQDGEQNTSETRQNVRVVTLEKSDKQKGLKIQKAPRSQFEKSPCGISHFSVFLRKGKKLQERVIDCQSKKTIQTKTSLLTGPLTSPSAVWYFHVDPHNSGKAEINNQQLLKLSVQFRVEFLGHDPGLGVLTYRFLEPK